MSACVPEKILNYESITWMFEVNVSLGNQNQSNCDVSINYRELHQKVIPGDFIYRSILAKSLVVSISMDSMNCSSPGSSVHGILQARILECVAMLSSRRSFQSREWTYVSCIYLHW